jgi:NADH-quinone oxidoreductase subunit J
VGEQIVFGFAAAGALVCGTMVITLKGPFRATVALIGTLLSVAVLFLLMAAPFVAAIQVIVYAGAIVVLFLFVIAYLGERPLAEAGDRLGRYTVAAWLAVIALAIQGVVVLANIELPGVRDEPKPVGDIGSPAAIGHAFLDRFIVPFEATSLALLVAAVGAVLLAKRAIRAEGGR